MFIIAEIAQAHDGSLGIVHSLIDALSETGVDAIKFQTHIAEAESSEFEPFRVKFSYEDASRFEYWKRMEFTTGQWNSIKLHCDDRHKEFISSPFSNAAVDILEKLNVKRYKIGSGEISNFLLLDKVARTGKPILLSSGMSSFIELDETISFLKPFGNDLSILQCNTEYPTSPEQLGLNVIEELKLRYGLNVGLSDHSGSIYPAMAAAGLGATIIEVHCTFDRRMFGPDASSSLTIDEISELVKGLRVIEKSLSNPVNKNDNLRFAEQKKIFGKSLSINKDLKKGTILKFDDLESKKPADKGIPARQFAQVIGKKLSRDLKQWSFINEEDLE